eukprot:jgi/Bigna1/80425/fgenesh1_pg.71_\
MPECGKLLTLNNCKPKISQSNLSGSHRLRSRYLLDDKKIVMSQADYILLSMQGSGKDTWDTDYATSHHHWRSLELKIPHSAWSNPASDKLPPRPSTADVLNSTKCTGKIGKSLDLPQLCHIHGPQFLGNEGIYLLFTQMITSARKHITDRLLSNWDKTGKKKAVEILKKFAQDAALALPGSTSSVSLKTLLTEIVSTVMLDQKKTSDMVTLCKEGGMEAHSHMQTAMTDTIWVLSLEKSEEDQRKGLNNFAKELVKTDQIPSWLYLERLTKKQLGEMDIMPSATINTKEVRTRTRMYLLQRKFNLLREESEGWAKVVGEAFTFMNSPKKDRLKPKDFQQRLTSLLGYFDLDPNRIMDIILDAFEAEIISKPAVDTQLCADVFEVLDQFKPDALCSLLGFKFQFYQKGGLHPYFSSSSSSSKAPASTPESLFRLASLCIAYGKIELNALWSYLLPADQTMIESREKFVQDIMQKAAKVHVISLKEEKMQDNTGTQHDLGSNNQKVDLIHQLLDIGDWRHAQKVYRKCCVKYRLLGAALEKHEEEQNQKKGSSRTGDGENAGEEEDGMEVEVVDGKGTGSQHPNSDYVGSSSSSSGSVSSLPWGMKPVEDLKQLPDVVWPIAEHLSVYLHRDPKLFTKLCRLCCEYVISDKKSKKNVVVKGDKLLEGKLELIIEELLIPAFSLMGSNPAMASELWKLLKEFPYWERHQIYGFWRDHGYKLAPEMRMQQALSIKHVQQFNRRISNTTKKMMGRFLVKVAFSNPMVVVDGILDQQLEYENQHDWVLNAFKYFHGLAFDCLIYCMLMKFSMEKTRSETVKATACLKIHSTSNNVVVVGASMMRLDGLHLAKWFRNGSKFCGNFYHSFPNTELTAMIQFVVNRLKNLDALDETCVEVVILRELVSQMTGINVVEDLGDVQLEGQSGGPILQTDFTPPRSLFLDNEQGETATFRRDKKKKKLLRKSTGYLLDCLKSNKFILPLFLLLSHAKYHIMFKSEIPHLVLMSELIDKTQGVLIQLGEFVQQGLKTSDYAQQLPSLYDLVKKYHLTPADAFYIARPVLQDKRISSPPKVDTKVGGGSSDSAATTAVKMEEEEDIAAKKKKKSDDPPKSKEQLARERLLKAQKRNSDGPSRYLGMPGTPLCDTAKLLLPPSTWDKISPEFYTVFWEMDRCDLAVPEKLYEDQISKLKAQIADGPSPDLKDQKWSKEKDRMLKTMSKLRDEVAAQRKNQKSVMETLKKRKDYWLADMKSKSETGSCFLQYCILPRCFLTPNDALYCAKFLETILKIDTPWLSMIHFYDQLIKTNTGRSLAVRAMMVHTFLETQKKYWKKEEILPGAPAKAKTKASDVGRKKKSPPSSAAGSEKKGGGGKASMSAKAKPFAPRGGGGGFSADDSRAAKRRRTADVSTRTTKSPPNNTRSSTDRADERKNHMDDNSRGDRRASKSPIRSRDRSRQKRDSESDSGKRMSNSRDGGNSSADATFHGNTHKKGRIVEMAPGQE